VKVVKENTYSKFKFIVGNRPIVAAKVSKLVDVVTGGLNLFEYCPILVNKDMYVIDGQHRLEACKRMKLPVYYCVVEKITLNQIAKINSSQNKWNMNDFFNCFIQTGIKDYKTLKEFKEKYDISTGIAAQLLMYGTVNDAGGGSVSEDFREGLFRIQKRESAEKIMKTAYDYQNVADLSIIKNRNFLRAIQELLRSKEYNHQEVIDKLNLRKSVISKKSNFKEYAYQIEELFNRGNSNRRIIYKSSK
jgi:hypothetical protein